MQESSQVRAAYLGDAALEERLLTQTHRRTESSPVSGESTQCRLLRSITAGYGDTVALREVDFTAGDGEIVALLGTATGATTSPCKRAAWT